jgi:hypothetical protein
LQERERNAACANYRFEFQTAKDNCSAVIASEAKQSISQRKERTDCFVAYAPRNDVDVVLM